MIPHTTVASVIAYIRQHNDLMGFPPKSVGLSNEEYCAVAIDAGLSEFQARCTNVTFKLQDVPIVRV